jgi:hypothetical protein
MSATGMVHAPWSAAQVESLNGYQHSLAGHPFTCPGAHENRGEVVLVAWDDGWHCPEDCGYAQTWAHEFMADGSWREVAAEIQRALSPGDPVTQPTWTLTRSQLIDALANIELRVKPSGPMANKVSADEMADAILAQLGRRPAVSPPQSGPGAGCPA